MPVSPIECCSPGCSIWSATCIGMFTRRTTSCFPEPPPWRMPHERRPAHFVPGSQPAESSGGGGVSAYGGGADTPAAGRGGRGRGGDRLLIRGADRVRSGRVLRHGLVWRGSAIAAQL